MSSVTRRSPSNPISLAFVVASVLAFSLLRVSQELSRWSGLAVATLGVIGALVVMLVLLRHALGPLPRR